ncbi:DUF6705 family protein [Flavobacterium sp. WV_118_3]|uniref:DUF6705 family protein n=1 Tax=Flavobacterium sp. WV_118_3 TaxID=3151764 RepID=UPI00321932FA
MKNILLSLLTVFIIFSCKAQTIVPLADSHSEAYHKPNTYTKDVDNEFGKYEGTWKYQEGNKTLIIKLKKKNFDYFPDKNYYEDLLIGEYAYSVNGTELINTLDKLNVPQTSTGAYDIYGNRIVHRGIHPICADCSLDEKRVILFIDDPERDYLDNSLVLRYKIENGTQKIIAKIYKSGASVFIPAGAIDEMRVPYGEYILTKQP